MIIWLLLITYPATFGGKGIYRTKSADIEWLLEGRSILVLNVDGEAYRYDYTDSTSDYGSGRVGIGYTPAKKSEVYMLWRVHGEGTATLPVSESDFTGDLGDLDLGFKYVLKKFRSSYLSIDLPFTIPIGADGYTNDGFIFYPKALFTYDFSDHWRLMPIRAHFNLGSPIGRQDLSDNFPLTGAFALELPSKFFTFFMELSRNHERDWNWRFTPGFRFHPFYRLGLVAAADFGLTEDYRLFGANVGISLNSSLTKERETLPTGNIAGEIRDQKTHEPLCGTISIIELDEKETTEKYGVYKILGIPRGVYTLVVEVPYYATESRAIVVEANRTRVSNFQLQRASIQYQGIVKDSRTGELLSDASIEIAGKTTTHLLTDEQGSFSEMLFPGDYEIRVNKEKYAQHFVQLLLQDDRFDTITLRPIEIAEETPEAIVYFDIDDANIREDQRTTIDRIGEFLKQFSHVRCELRGHTDPSGKIEYNQILSLARANSVKDYLVKVHGIEKNRISTLAFSKTKLVRESPEKSRRVEIFLIR